MASKRQKKKKQTNVSKPNSVGQSVTAANVIAKNPENHFFFACFDSFYLIEGYKISPKSTK